MFLSASIPFLHGFPNPTGVEKKRKHPTRDINSLPDLEGDDDFAGSTFFVVVLSASERVSR